MFRPALRLLSKAQAVQAVKPAASLDPIGQFFSEENLKSLTIADVDTSVDINKLGDAEFATYFDKLMSSPLFQVDQDLMRSYREYENSFRELESIKILPQFPDTPIEIDWEFKKNFLPENVVDGFKQALETATADLEAASAEGLKQIEEAGKNVQSSIKELDSVMPEIENVIRDVQRSLDQEIDFKDRLKTITIEELIQKNPDLENEIYEDIANSEWMIKDRVGDDTIYNLKHHGGH